jgi:head-tail adaptor
MTRQTPQATTLDRLITIEKKLVSRDDAFGSEQVSWINWLPQVWARVWESTATPGNPTAAQMVEGHVRPHRIRIRWREGIDQDLHRLNYGGRLLRITGTAEVGRRQWLDLACDEWAHEQQ